MNRKKEFFDTIAVTQHLELEGWLAIPHKACCIGRFMRLRMVCNVSHIEREIKEKVESIVILILLFMILVITL